MFLLRFALLLIIMSFCFGFSVQAQEADDWKKDARKIWLQGFEYYEKGEKCRQDGQLRESLTLYKESLTYFEKIKAKYPTWNTALIDFRIKVCTRKLEELKVEFEKQNIKFTETEIDRENLLLKNRLAAMEKELSDTKTQLDNTFASLESARREAARNVKVSQEMDQLIKEKIALSNRCALLEDQNKQLQSKNGATAEVADKNTLDKALLQIETLKKDKEKLISILETEKQKFVVLAGKNNELTYQLKQSEKTGTVSGNNQVEIEKRIVVLEEAAHQAEKEKEEVTLQLKAAEETISQAEATIKKLRDDIQKTRTNADVNTGAITQQLSNDNELILKSLETANLKLIQKTKEAKDLADELKALKEKTALLEKTLAGIDENREKIVDDLKMLNKKVFIADTITQKQDQTIIEQKEQYEKLKKDFDALAKQVEKQSNKEKEFTELAKQSVEAENKNRQINEEIKKVQDENMKLVNAIKQIQINLIKAQKDYKDIVNELAKSEQENLKLKVTYNQENLQLSKKSADLTKQLEDLKKSTADHDNKMELLTDELVSVNSSLAKKEKEIEELKKTFNQVEEAAVIGPEPALQQTPAVAEPVVVAQTPEYMALKRENNQLLAALNAKEEEVRNLKQTTVAVSNTSVVDQDELKKLLDGAAAAEKEGKNEAAIWYYEKVLKLEPGNQKALTALGTIEAGTGNDKKAIPILTKALTNDDTNMELLLALTFCYIRQEKYYEALGVASRASAQDPKDPTIQRYMGIICSYLGWNDAAERQFRNSFKLDPTSSETAYNAAVHIAKTSPERKEEAKLWYDRAIQLGAQRDPVMEKLFK